MPNSRPSLSQNVEPGLDRAGIEMHNVRELHETSIPLSNFPAAVVTWVRRRQGELCLITYSQLLWHSLSNADHGYYGPDTTALNTFSFAEALYRV